MTETELCAAYTRVAQSYGLPPMTCTALQVETHDLAGGEAAWQALVDHSPTSGWLLFQSQVAAFVDVLPEPPADWGGLLAAEVVDAQGRSLHLRQVGEQWRLTIAQAADPEGATEVFLADRIQHLATDRVPGSDPKRLYHRRYWHRDPLMGVSPVFAAFQGFTRPEEI